MAHSETDTFGLNVSYAFMPELKLTAFYYDIEGEDLAATTSETVGVRAAGKIKAGDVMLSYSASMASQSDMGPNGDAPDADYFAADVSAALSGVTFGMGFEILESGFRTPFATVHKFNGYADVFLPLTGIDEWS